MTTFFWLCLLNAALGGGNVYMSRLLKQRFQVWLWALFALLWVYLAAKEVIAP